jgi:hypothetical protein
MCISEVNSAPGVHSDIITGKFLLESTLVGTWGPSSSPEFEKVSWVVQAFRPDLSYTWLPVTCMYSFIK